MSTGVVFPRQCPAEYLAVARLSDEVVGLFPIEDALRLSKQVTPKLYWFFDAATAPLGALTEQDVADFRVERMVVDLAAAAR